MPVGSACTPLHLCRRLLPWRQGAITVSIDVMRTYPERAAMQQGGCAVIAMVTYGTDADAMGRKQAASEAGEL